jgi:uncharacterized membrane protein YhhN
VNLRLSPRLPGDRTFLFLAVVSTVALTVLRALSLDSIARWWIPAFEIVLLARAVFPLRPWSRQRTRLTFALAFCLAGDLLINWTAYGNLCIAFFAITHLNLLWIFARLRRPVVADIPSLLPWCVASLVVFVSVAAALPKPWMAPALVAYLLLLDLMVWRALALLAEPRPAGGIFLALGGVLFFATDHLVVLQILRPAPIWVVATWICYPPALTLLALSSRHLASVPLLKSSGTLN